MYYLPSMVRVKPTTEQKAGPMAQPCCRAATVSTGIPNTDTSSSEVIRFISSRLNSVRSCNISSLLSSSSRFFSCWNYIRILQLIGILGLSEFFCALAKILFLNVQIFLCASASLEMVWKFCPLQQKIYHFADMCFLKVLLSIPKQFNSLIVGVKLIYVSAFVSKEPGKILRLTYLIQSTLV